MKHFKYPEEIKVEEIENKLRKPDGRGSNSRVLGESNLNVVREWVNENPGCLNIQCQRDTGFSYRVVARCFKIIFK